MTTGAFKFNFGEKSLTEEEEHVLVSAPAKVFIPQSHAAIALHTQVHIDSGAGQTIELPKAVIDNATAARLVGQPELCVADLVPGRYEGGFKVWEGALDLCRVLLRRHSGPWQQPAAAQDGAGTVGFAGLRVLELGCGHGLPGIVALLGGAHVTFHDFNEAVLLGATHPNVEAAARQHGAAADRARYISGDFASVSGHLCHEPGFQPFDMILTAESIYNLQSARQVVGCCMQCMTEGGMAYIAAKSHYFGVGGGLAAFKRLVDAEPSLRVTDIIKFDDGVSNVREVLVITKAGA